MAQNICLSISIFILLDSNSKVLASHLATSACTSNSVMLISQLSLTSEDVYDRNNKAISFVNLHYTASYSLTNRK